MITVTRPFLPPLEEFEPYLKEIWASRVLTNGGQFHQQLETALAEYLGVRHISLFSNGTLALITALQAMRITGEVITTPFSFVATTHALHWNGITPVFSDIEPTHFNLDPARIEAAITPRTTALLPVHVYGNPCNTQRIKEVADNYGLKVIYDAAHAFGVRTGITSLLEAGDLSVLSFHATKVFNTFEGGAIISHDVSMKRRIDFLKNFGFADETTVVAPGINAKMNEVQSAFGLLQLKFIDGALEERRNIAFLYREKLEGLRGVETISDIAGVRHNYSYFPILIETAKYGLTRDEVYDFLKANGIYSRRYFYPLISQFPTYKYLPSAAPANLPVAEAISRQVLCLPIYPGLSIDDIERIVGLLRSAPRR